MPSAITAAGIDWSAGDLITRAVTATLRADTPLMTYLGGNIFRRSVYFPAASGVLPRIIVAAMERTEVGAISSRLSGVHRVGIIYEFQEAQAKLEDDQPSADSVLNRIQAVLAPLEAGGYRSDPLDPTSNGMSFGLIYDSAKWGTVTFNPAPIQGSKEDAVAFFVGAVVEYRYKVTFPGRQVIGRPA